MHPIDRKLKQLREDYKKYPGKRDVILVVAKTLKRLKEEMEENDQRLMKDVKDELF